MLWRSNTKPRHYSHINQISLLLKTKKGSIVRNTAVLLQLLFSSPFNHLWPFFPNQRTVFIHFTKIYILCLDSMGDQNGENSPSPPPPPHTHTLSFCWGKPEKRQQLQATWTLQAIIQTDSNRSVPIWSTVFSQHFPGEVKGSLLLG